MAGYHVLMDTYRFAVCFSKKAVKQAEIVSLANKVFVSITSLWSFQQVMSLGPFFGEPVVSLL